MRLLLTAFLPAISLPALAEEKPKTYKECIKNASDINSQWIEYRADVNKCRDKFDVPGKY